MLIRTGRGRQRRMFPHTVTIYNQIIETDKITFKTKITNYITILRGVMLDETKAVNVRTSGLTNADAVTLYIPADVLAVDGINGNVKRYAKPMEWTQSDDDDKSGLWTMTLDGQGEGDTFFISGEVVDDTSLDDLSWRYDGVYNITKVDLKHFGSRLDHWEVGGE